MILGVNLVNKLGDIMSNANTGLETIFGAERLTVDKKSIINSRSDLNQIVPIRYKWLGKYLSARKNLWMPEEVNMIRDLECWSSLTDLGKSCENELRIFLYS